MRVNKLIIIRRFSQAFFLALFIYILWSTTYPLRGLLPPGTFFKINPYIMMLTSLSQRVLIPGIIIGIAMLALTLVFGRFYCGWICPLGTLIDYAGAFRRKKRTPSAVVNSRLRKGKFIALGITAILAAAGVQAAWVLDPMVVAARFVSLNLIPTATLLLNDLFIFLMRDMGLYQPLQGIYQSLKSSVLGVKVVFFSNAGAILALTLGICLASLFISRIWCRMLCPLGATYALAAKAALLSRANRGCSACGLCKSSCRMGAIKDDMSYVKSECILCMDCVYECPGNITNFSFSGLTRKNEGTSKVSSGNMTRTQFLLLMFASLSSMAFRWRGGSSGSASFKSGVIRPPAALKEPDFFDRCIRCGNCMKVCPTNGLQPVMLESGLSGLWTPHLVPEIGYCEYNCTLCGTVCPTEAIKKLSLAEKHMIKLGTAVVDRSTCIAWAGNQQCIVCEEHCPVPMKAIKVDTITVNGSIVKRPVVDKSLCVGCGICQTKCPVRPVRAIKVSPEGAYRP